MAVQGYKALLQVAFGTEALVDYALVDSGDGLLFHTQTSHGYIFDPRVAITVKVDGVAVPAADYTVIPLLGHVVFAADPTPTTGVTISCTRLKLHTVAECYQATFDVALQTIPKPVFNTEHTPRKTGLGDCTGTLSRFYEADEDFDEGGGTFTPWDDVGDPGILTVVSFRPDPTPAGKKVKRAWAYFEQESFNTEVTNLHTAVLTWKGTVPKGARKSFAIGELFPDNS